MVTKPAETLEYDPRGLLGCMSPSGVLMPYRTLAESDRFVYRHKGHPGFVILRSRRAGWRRAA